MTVSLRMGLAAAAALGLSGAAGAQPLPAAPAAPQVVKWPGGYVVINGSEVITRHAAPGRSTTVVTGAGNGVGNKIVVDNGTGGGVTIVRGSRIGVGNTIVTDPDDLFLDLDEWLKPCPKPAPPVPMAQPKLPPADPLVAPAEPLPLPDAAPVAPPSYKGKASAFWSKRAFSDALDCNVYWCPATKLWFRYHADADTYHPVPVQPPAPGEEK